MLRKENYKTVILRWRQHIANSKSVEMYRKQYVSSKGNNEVIVVIVPTRRISFDSPHCLAERPRVMTMLYGKDFSSWRCCHTHNLLILVSKVCYDLVQPKCIYSRSANQCYDKTSCTLHTHTYLSMLNGDNFRLFSHATPTVKKYLKIKYFILLRSSYIDMKTQVHTSYIL